MIKHILNPNLPQGNVKHIICGTQDKLIADFFDNVGINVLKNEANADIDSSVSCHADMAAVYLGDGKIVIDKNQVLLRQKLRELGFTVIDTSEHIKGLYPDDVRLNFTLTEKNAFGCFRYADYALSENITEKNMINVRQGYCKCSVLVVDENSFITDDASIFKTMKENGFDVLLIEKGDIYLEGHGYGFIGGASGKISHNTVVFFGDITSHTDFEKINEFLRSHGCSYLCTDNGRLRDIGGIIPLTQEFI